MNIFFKTAGILAAAAFISSPVSEYSGNSIQMNLVSNKCEAQFDTSSVLESGFAPIDISDDISSYETESENFPSSFDLRDYGLIQNVKVQGGYGTCWAQTASDSAETSLIKRNPSADLSEWHLSYYSYTGGEQIDIGDISGNNSVFQHGGSALVAANMWAQWKGPATEKEGLEYGNMNILTDTELQEKYRNYADYHLKNAYLFDFRGDNPTLRNKTIKDFLLKGQAIDISYYNNSNYYDSVHNSYMSGKDMTATHSVTIVGYDDNFPAENFTSNARPESDGAWLAKNSWGNTWLDNGFFWISYEEPSLCEFSVFELEDSNNYKKNYYHDTFITSQTMKAGHGDTSYIANVFQSEGDEWLQAVSFNFPVPNTDYQIDIYKNLATQSDPLSGTNVYSMTGMNSITGYQTIELGENISLSEGEYFSIVIKMTNSDNPYTIPIESCLCIVNNDTGEMTDLSNHTTYQQIQNYTHENESFYSSNGISWNDVINSEYHYSDAEKTALYKAFISVYGESFVSSFEENFGNDDIIVAQGNIPIKAFTNPINHVDFSADSGLIYSDELIELSCGNSQDIYYSLNGGEYILYTEPIQITEQCSITATTDFETFSEKNYTPAYSMLNRLGYTFNKTSNVQYITSDENGNYTIDADISQSSIMLLPVSMGTVKINDEISESYHLTNEIPLNEGKNTISIYTNTENAVPSEITLTINRGDTAKSTSIGDVNNDGVVNASDASAVLAEYAVISSGKSGSFDDIKKAAADFNKDEVINASDASVILAYYAYLSSGGTDDAETFASKMQ